MGAPWRVGSPVAQESPTWWVGRPRVGRGPLRGGQSRRARVPRGWLGTFGALAAWSGRPVRGKAAAGADPPFLSGEAVSGAMGAGWMECTMSRALAPGALPIRIRAEERGAPSRSPAGKQPIAGRPSIPADSVGRCEERGPGRVLVGRRHPECGEATNPAESPRSTAGTRASGPATARVRGGPDPAADLVSVP